MNKLARRQFQARALGFVIVNRALSFKLGLNLKWGSVECLKEKLCQLKNEKDDLLYSSTDGLPRGTVVRVVAQHREVAKKY